jgi:hypothetical protein
MNILALILELIGILAIGLGIFYEVIHHAGVGFIAITVGSLLIAVGALIWAKIIHGRK